MKLTHFFFLLFTVSLCIASVFIFIGIYQAQQAGYGSALETHKLLNTPEKFIVLESPDQYVLRALSNPGTPVFVDLKETLIDSIIQCNGTNNVFFENSYYEITVLYACVPGVFAFMVPLMITWTVWGIVAIVIVSIRYRKKNKR